MSLRHRIEVVAKLLQYLSTNSGDPKMSSHLANGYAERSRIEHDISECDLLISKIKDERLLLASGIAECNSLRRELAGRQYTLRTSYRNSMHWHNAGVRRSVASR